MSRYKLYFVAFFAGMWIADSPLLAQPLAGLPPLQVVKKIGDKLIRTTPFAYRIKPATVSKKLDGLQFVDFGRSLGTHRTSMAYAYTHIEAKQAGVFEMQLAHTDACAIWLNGKIVYQLSGKRPLELHYEERSIEMPFVAKLNLREGTNTLLIQSTTYGGEWVLYMQPPATKGAVTDKPIDYPGIGLGTVPRVDAAVAQLSNWLLLGPFHADGVHRMPVAEGQNPVFGTMYNGMDGATTWTIPKVEVLGDVIDPTPWGTNYNWNYHNGGVAWAMQHLAEVSGDTSYAKYATDFCDFHINGAPFVQHQVKDLRAVNSANSHFLFVPLLDFTLAPSLPFIYRLRNQTAFANRSAYEKHVERMLRYAKNEQVRLPALNIYTRLTPEKYTTWVDDMFMGIPFLMQAAQYAATPAERDAWLNDAAMQILNFNKVVWNEDSKLYSHARYSERAVQLPHWSRANGWGIWATTEVLNALPKTHPQYKAILAHYQTHVNALVKLQNKNGFWLQLLDRPNSPEEVSGTAIFTMAIARGIHKGWLKADTYRPYAEKGWSAIKSQIESDGTVHNICYGTMCSEDENYYLQRPFYDDDTHGLFAVLFAGIEMHLMQQQMNFNEKVKAK